jgi:hypothetical protein
MLHLKAVLTCLLSTMLLKKGVEEGLTLFDLGSMLQRPDFGDSKSVFERTVDRTLNIVGAQDGEAGAEVCFLRACVVLLASALTCIPPPSFLANNLPTLSSPLH